MSLIQQWLTASLFCLGMVILLLGIVLVAVPDRVRNASRGLDRWISTELFFRTMDKPHNLERSFYHHHRLFGVLIMLGALYVLYALTLPVDVDTVIASLPVIKNQVLSSWVYSSARYVLIGMNAVIVLAGAVILFRPSLLKAMETYANRWITSDKPVQQLNQSHAIPEHIFPRNIRLFGVAVTLAGVYIMLATGARLL